MAKLKVAGSVIKKSHDNPNLADIGVKNNDQISFTIEGDWVSIFLEGEKHRSSRITKNIEIAAALDERIDKPNFLSGQLGFFYKNNQSCAEELGFILHSLGRELIRRGDYREAVQVLAVCEESLSLCSPKASRIGVHVVQLNMAWCYLMLEDGRFLPDAAACLLDARKGFQSIDWEDPSADIALHLMLELSECIIAYHFGHIKKSRQLLTSSREKLREESHRKVYNEALSILKSMGYMENEDERALNSEDAVKTVWDVPRSEHELAADSVRRKGSEMHKSLCNLSIPKFNYKKQVLEDATQDSRVGYCEGLVDMILRKCPIKTIIRFQSICSFWRDSIDSPIFVAKQLALQRPCFIFQIERAGEYRVLNCNVKPYSVKLLHNPFTDFLRFCSTHHGVVCLFDANCYRMILWNPSICKHMSISVPFENLGWDQESLVWFGFWINPLTTEFKFLVIHQLLNDVEEGELIGIIAILYSSVQRSWRTYKRSDFGYIITLRPPPPVMIKDIAYWRGMRPLHNKHVILSFDFMAEDFDMFECPEVSYGLQEPVHFHFKGFLSVIAGSTMYLKLGENWRKVQTLGLNSCLRVFWVLEEDEELKTLEVDLDTLVVHDSVNFIPITYEGLQNYGSVVIAYDFVESLLFPSLL